MSQALAPTRRNVPRRHPVALFVAAGILYALAAVLLAGGGWAFWQDRVERDSGGFVTIGSSEFRTDTYALTSPLHGDGPRWLYGPAVFGDVRIRGTSNSQSPIFIGVARTSDVDQYIAGTGHATIQHFATGDVTTHSGGAQKTPPDRSSIWDGSTQGTGEQTLVWKTRAGDWSVVIMNMDASPGVAVSGDIGAEFPPLPWVGAGLLGAGVLVALLATWLLVRGLRGRRAPSTVIDLTRNAEPQPREVSRSHLTVAAQLGVLP
jgi:hypothetical protein